MIFNNFSFTSLQNYGPGIFFELKEIRTNDFFSLIKKRFHFFTQAIFYHQSKKEKSIPPDFNNIEDFESLISKLKINDIQSFYGYDFKIEEGKINFFLMNIEGIAKIRNFCNSNLRVSPLYSLRNDEQDQLQNLTNFATDPTNNDFLSDRNDENLSMIKDVMLSDDGKREFIPKIIAEKKLGEDGFLLNSSNYKKWDLILAYHFIFRYIFYTYEDLKQLKNKQQNKIDLLVQKRMAYRLVLDKCFTAKDIQLIMNQNNENGKINRLILNQNFLIVPLDEKFWGYQFELPEGNFYCHCNHTFFKGNKTYFTHEKNELNVFFLQKINSIIPYIPIDKFVNLLFSKKIQFIIYANSRLEEKIQEKIVINQKEIIINHHFLLDIMDNIINIQYKADDKNNQNRMIQFHIASECQALKVQCNGKSIYVKNNPGSFIEFSIPNTNNRMNVEIILSERKIDEKKAGS